MEEVKPAATGSENATQEQGYLMAYDKKEQKAKGVKGIAANGELETLEANETNKSQFIRVDRHGNFFTNFGKNFMYQYNHPTRYALYRMEEKTPVEEAKRRIEQAQLPENESLRRELSRDNRIYNNHLFNEREINWQQAERYGLTPDVLRQTGDMERLLQGRQSGIAYDISMNTELGRQKGDAKLSLFRDENGLAKFDLHFIRQAPKVGQEYRGYKLEEDVLDALNRTGNAGRLVDLVVDFRSKETKPCYLSKDPVTNEMFFLPADQARCPKKSRITRSRSRSTPTTRPARRSPSSSSPQTENPADLHPDERRRTRDRVPVGKKHEEAGEQTGAGTEGQLAGENAEA